MKKISGIRFKQENDGVLSLHGELAFANTTTCFKEGCAHLQTMTGDCRIDFTHVQHNDSAFVACLLAWLRFAMAHQLKLVFQGFSSSMQDLLRLYQLDFILEGGAVATRST